jgi:hypothetical protein
MKVLADHANVELCLAIGLVVVRGYHVGLNLKVLHQLLPEVRGESTVSVGDNR